MTALGALKRIRARGFSVPRDISLVGFDDLFVAQYADPPLTTVRQPRWEMGRLAVEELIRLLRGSRSEHVIRVPGELVVRDSTAAPKDNNDATTDTARSVHQPDREVRLRASRV
jgi:DNA-binding LacI/PurR family transcriptional regulator